MKRLVFLLGLCVCMAYGGEYDKQKAEFMSKNFESKLKELVKESGLKSESAKLLYQVAIVPALYESGLKGNDSNGGWEIYTISLNYKGSNGRYYFWNQYERLAQRVSEVCGVNIGSEAYGISENYTPAQQKCIKSLATLELEMNKDIFKWNLEQMKSDKDEESNSQQKDLTPSYQLADMLWEKFKKEAKLGVIKDFNKPGMEQFVKGVFYWWIVGDETYRGIYSIDDFFHFYKKKLDGDFSFLYDSIETNNKKLEQKLSDAYYGDPYYGRKMKIYLSTKEYQEAIRQEQIEQEKKERLSRAKALKEFISDDVGFSQKSLEFNACLGLGDDENQNAETLFSGQYAEIFDKKYYANENREVVDDELKKQALYRQLAWCAIKDRYNDESQENHEYKNIEKDLGFSSLTYHWQYESHKLGDRENSAAARKIAAVAETLFARIFDRKWEAMAEKYPYVDYESAIENPWYEDETKIKLIIDDLEKNIISILENLKQEESQCYDKILIFSNTTTCQRKLREKTLKQLQAKLK